MQVTNKLYPISTRKGTPSHSRHSFHLQSLGFWNYPSSQLKETRDINFMHFQEPHLVGTQQLNLNFKSFCCVLLHESWIINVSSTSKKGTPIRTVLIVWEIHAKAHHSASSHGKWATRLLSWKRLRLQPLFSSSRSTALVSSEDSP
jgi:hypothetical protein